MTSTICNKSTIYSFHHPGRIALLLLLFASQLLFSQVTLSEGATIYFNGSVIKSADTLSKNSTQKKLAIIYVSKGVKITNLNTVSNFELVELQTSQKELKSPAKTVAKAVTEKLEQKNEPQKPVKTVSEFADFDLISTKKSETYFSFSNNASKVFVPVSQHSAKHLIHHTVKTSFIQWHWKKLGLVEIYDDRVIYSTVSYQFSIRPPPSLV